jgi:arginyl-tRNA synthetase
MNAYEQIRNELLAIAPEGAIFSLDISESVTHGDYATNIAFVLSKQKGASPKACADELVQTLKERLSAVVSDVQVAGPGFINFFLRDDVLRKENSANELKLHTKYTGKDILVEHSSPNLFKPFSIGHLMNNIVGEFVVRATKAGGATVETMSFPSDYSLGIAKALYIILKDKKDISYFINSDEEEVIKYLGEAYARGVKESEESEEVLSESKKILDKMYNLSDDDFHLLFSKIRQINESYFKKVLEGIDSVIDDFQYESWAGDRGKKVVLENTPSVFKQSDGAVVYIPDESRKDINTSVFINSQGYPTYEAKDLGLLEIKFKWRTSKFENFYPDYSFFITDAEQIPHFKVVLDAASKLGGKWSEWVAKSYHVPHGRMLFKGAKMSSRLGGVPLALDVIGVVEEEVRERAGEKIAYLNDEDKKKLEREIALSALRIAVLRSKPGININFDPETSLSFEGDSGPYLLYTHARCSSLLEKGKDKGYEPKFGSVVALPIEHELVSFELVLKDAVETLAPQKLVTYLFKVAQSFNSFYGNTQIISDDKVLSEHNLAIVKRVKFVLKEGPYVLGISAPERM